MSISQNFPTTIITCIVEKKQTMIEKHIESIITMVTLTSFFEEGEGIEFLFCDLLKTDAGYDTDS
jgi:hypothetical protein